MTAAAEAYDRHLGRYGRQLAAGLTGAAAIRPGQRVLDVGCGPGAPTRELAAIVGAEHVSAIDPCPAFVQACRARVPGAGVQIGVAENLPFPGGTFDAGRFHEGERIGFRDPELLATLWNEAGLVEVITDQLLVCAHHDDFDDLFTPFSHQGPATRAPCTANSTPPTSVACGTRPLVGSATQRASSPSRPAPGP